MFSKLEFLIAFRYLKSKRQEGFISVIAVFSFIGIMIGVATLIIVMSVMNGFRYELVSRILGINSHLTIYSRDGAIENYQDIINKLQDNPQIDYVNPLVESQVMVAANNKANGGLVKGINLDDLKNKKLINRNIISGEIDDLNGKNAVIIGITLASNLNLGVGDKVKIISPESNNTIIGAIPRIKTYNVVGVFESGMHEYDSTTIFMPLRAAQVHFRFKGSASAIEIFSQDANNMVSLKRELNTLLINEYPYDYLVDWQQSNASFIDALKVERTVMFLILTLIILVAAFNIISSLIMLVNDKKKNIACLRTMGMYKSSVLRIFLICGSIIGFLGTFLGVSIGLLFSSNINNIKLWLESVSGTSLFNPTIYFLSKLPSKIFLSDVLVITIMSLLLSFLATIYPALKASKANPAEILRY
jgi:lipoprotein-releasing system permease protein